MIVRRITMDISKHLKTLRLMSGKTQCEIAKEAGFGQGIYANWEAGRILPSAENLIKLANVYNCSVDYLLGRETEEGNIQIVGHQLSEEEFQFVQTIRRLGTRERNMLRGFMDALL